MEKIEHNLVGLQAKVKNYYAAVETIQAYRKRWQKGLKKEIFDFLQKTAQEAGLKCTLETREDITNLEAVVLSLGSGASGLEEPVSDGLLRDLIKQNGSLIYQQLFNGKVMVMVNYPYIEKYGQPQQPKSMGIFRPEELNQDNYFSHLIEFMNEIILWENYDDDQPEPNQRIGFKFNFDAPDGHLPKNEAE